MKELLEAVKENKNIILFIDELHTIIGAGAAEGAIDAANIIKPALARGEMQAIGATTLNEYRKNIQRSCHTATGTRHAMFIAGCTVMECR